MLKIVYDIQITIYKYSSQTASEVWYTVILGSSNKADMQKTIQSNDSKSEKKSHTDQEKRRAGSKEL